MACFVANTSPRFQASISAAKVFDFRVTARMVTTPVPEEDPAPAPKAVVKAKVVSRLSVSTRPKSVSVRSAMRGVEVKTSSTPIKLTSASRALVALRTRYSGASPKLSARPTSPISSATASIAPLFVSSSARPHELFAGIVCPVSFGTSVIMDDWSAMAWDDGHPIKY